MPNVAQGMIIQVRAEWEMYGQQDLSVWHWRVSDAGGAPDLFTFLKNGVNTEILLPGNALQTMLLSMSQDMMLRGVVSQCIFPTRYRSVRTSSNTNGGDADPAGTNNIAMSIGVSGDLAGRGRAGRTQIPGIPKKWQIGAKWDPAIVAVMGDAIEALRVNVLAPAGFTTLLDPIIWSARTSTYQRITAKDDKITVRTMRRRTFGVGQ